MLEVKTKTERQIHRGRPRIKEATRDLVVKLYNEDYPIANIAEACNISEGSVFRILKERRQQQQDE